MRIDHQVVVFDAADLEAESSFWAGVLDGTVDVEDDWHMVIVGGEPRVGVQRKPNHVPPDWPDGTSPPWTTSRSTRILPGIPSACAGFNDESRGRARTARGDGSGPGGEPRKE